MEKRKTFCGFCSLECDLAVRMPERNPYFNKDQLMEQDFDLENVNEGSICAKGNFTVDYVNHPKRLSYAERNHNVVTNEEAFDRIKIGFSKVMEKHGKDSVAILAGGNLSQEEIFLIKQLATEGFKTKNFGFFLPDDSLVMAGLLATGYSFDRPSYNEIEKSEQILVVGDAFYEHPVIAKKILQAKYEERKNQLFVIDPRYSNTAWFADVHLQCKPGTEGLVLMALAMLTAKGKGGSFSKALAGESVESLADKAGVSVDDLKWVADSINNSESTAIVISQIMGKIGFADVAAAYCKIIADGNKGKRSFYPIFINQSVFPIAALKSESNNAGAAEILENIVKGKIKGLLLLGTDFLESLPAPGLEKGIRGLEFFCCSDTFKNTTNNRADILLAAANPIEKDGVYFDLDGKRKERTSLLPAPGGGMADADILKTVYQLMTGSHVEAESSLSDLPEIKAVEKYTKSVVARSEALTKMKGFHSNKFPFVLVTKAIASHWSDGSLTRRFNWNRESMTEPVLEIHPDDAEKLKIKDGQNVTVTSEYGKIKMPAKVSKRVQPQSVAVDYHWPEIRKLLPFKPVKELGELLTDPVPVTLGK